MKLSEKYRPTNEDFLIGEIQNSVYKSLTEGGVKNIAMWSGPSGTGKTTLARIYAANLLGCEASELKNESNFQHINARETGIGFFRDELLENIGIPPLFGNYRIYLFDEIHAFKKDTEQRLLLTLLESLPEHCVLLFCTDQPQMLDKALLSRLKPHYQLTVPTIKERREHMLKLLKLEGVMVEGQSGEGRLMSKQDANNIFLSSEGNLRALVDNIGEWLEGTFSPNITDENEKDDFVKEMFTGKLSLSEAFTLAKTIDSYNNTLHNMCGYAIAVLSKDSNSRMAGIASKILQSFGQGLNPNVAERVSFYYLLEKYYS